MREKFEQLSAIVIDVGKELGLNVRSQDVLGSNDRDTIQIAKLIIDTADEMLTRFPWRRTIGTNPWIKYIDGTFGYDLKADTDLILMDARTMKAGTKWRYLNTKGLTYDEQFRVYENRIQNFAFDKNTGDTVDTNVPAAVPL